MKKFRTIDHLAGYALLLLLGYGFGWILWHAAGGAGIVALALFIVAGAVDRLKP